jgi:hypothetical protein
MFRVFKLTIPLVAIIFMFALAPVPAIGQSSEPLEKMVDKMNADARKRGDELLAALKRTRCENNSDGSAVPEYEAFDQQMSFAELATTTLEPSRGRHLSKVSNAQLRLNIAGAAIASNCIKIADQLYRHVIKFYTEPQFAGHRDIARIGIDDTREKRTAQDAADQREDLINPPKIPRLLLGTWVELTERMDDLGVCSPRKPSDTYPFILKKDAIWKRANAESDTECSLNVAVDMSATLEKWKSEHANVTPPYPIAAAPDQSSKRWTVTAICGPEPIITTLEIWTLPGAEYRLLYKYAMIDGRIKNIGTYRRCN